MSDESNYRETDKSVRGLHSRAQAESIKALTERSLAHVHQDADHLLRVEERADGLFDLIVLKRFN
jgi:hypothetical protein